MPHFIDKLSVTGIELGSSVPSVCRVHPPFLDDRGLWVDLDITYEGGFIRLHFVAMEMQKPPS